MLVVMIVDLWGEPRPVARGVRDGAGCVPAHALRILVVDGSGQDAALMSRALARGRVSAELVRVDRREALDAALGAEWDLVLVDPYLPRLELADVIAAVRERQGDVPCVVVSAVLDARGAAAAIGKGARDFVAKQHLSGLAAVVAREVEDAETRREAARERAALQLAAGHLEALEASMPDRTFTFDADGRPVRTSGPPLGGGRREDPRALWSAFGPALQACLGRALRGTPTSHEWSVGPAGEERWFEARLNPVLVEGHVVGAVATIRDVSELRALNARLAIADRMAAIGSIAAGVAHDLSAPVAATLAALEEAERIARAREGALGEDGAALRRALADAREAGAQIRAVARDLRTFSRADSGGGEADVVEVLESAVRMAAHELRDRARVVRDYREVPRVVASQSRLGQVFLNLIVNAAQAIRRGAPERNEVRLRTAIAPDGRVAVEVEDTGAGMPAEVRQRLFTAFFTTKPAGEGTGLGLSICHRIVQGLGGTIDVRSEPGRGATFRVLLPASAAPASAPGGTGAGASGEGSAGDGSPGGGGPRPPPQELPRPATARPRVLVIDDEEAVHRAMSRLLGKICEVACAEPGDALRLLQGGERFDLVLCDVSMAELSGLDLYASLKELDPAQAARVVFLSGGAFAPEVKAFFARTGAAVLDKASPPDELRGAVEAHLGRARGA